MWKWSNGASYEEGEWVLMHASQAKQRKDGCSEDAVSIDGKPEEEEGSGPTP